MYAPAEDDEATTLVRHADQQLAAVHACLLGLTEDEARATPCRSVLSLGGIVKHVARVMSQAVATTTAAPGAAPDLDFAAHAASFVLAADETAAGLLERFEAVRPTYLAVLAEVDPDARTYAPPAPWDGIEDERPIRRRYQLVHQIEELARHAGHADIIREQIDGWSVPALVMTEAGAERTDFFTPCVPAAGTLGA